jgi:hypothetical protein
VLQIALDEEPVRRDRARAVADLKARRNLAALRRGGAGRLQRFVDQILKVEPAALEAGGLHVGQVVGDDVQSQLLRLHSGRGGP